jgi:hypothetical protein
MNKMNQDILDLSTRLHSLYEEIMKANPWDEGYGEVVAIHEYLMKALRDKAQKDFNEFKVYMEQAAKEIEETWKSSSSALGQWAEKLRPVFETVEKIVSNAVPLLALI